MTELRNVSLTYGGKNVGYGYTVENNFISVFDSDFIENYKDLAKAGLVLGFEIKVISNPAIPLTPEGDVVPLTPEEIDNRTLYHKGTDETMPLHKKVRQHYNVLMEIMNEILPDGRAKSVCMTELEDSEMWANKAVAELAPIVRE